VTGGHLVDEVQDWLSFNGEDSASVQTTSSLGVTEIRRASCASSMRLEVSVLRSMLEM